MKGKKYAKSSKARSHKAAMKGKKYGKKVIARK